MVFMLPMMLAARMVNHLIIVDISNVLLFPMDPSSVPSSARAVDIWMLPFSPALVTRNHGNYSVTCAAMIFLCQVVVKGCSLNTLGINAILRKNSLIAMRAAIYGVAKCVDSRYKNMDPICSFGERFLRLSFH